MIQKIIGTTITIDGILSLIYAHKHPTPYYLLLQIGRTIRTTLGIILCLI